MARRAAATTAETPVAAGNPHARQISAGELKKAVASHYGTMTLVADKVVAETLLEYNTANRGINKRKLQHLIDQMKAGEFENTGEPIIISAEGILSDGQHRLIALVESDITVELDVRFGIPRKAIAKTNTGTSRNGGDVLALRGVSGGAAIAPAVRLLILLKRGLPESVREFVSNAEIDTAYNRWKGIETVGKLVGGMSFPKGVRSTALLATAFLASRSAGKDKLESWLETLSTGLATNRNDPAYLLRERLMKGVDAPVGTREGMIEKFALTIMSWNAYAQGQGIEPKDFRWSATGKRTKPFPKVEGARI